MALYPIFIETKDRPVLVIGGGRVGAEKVRGLLAAEADVTVVSPELIDELRQHAAAGRIKHVARAYQETDLDAGWQWVMVATDDGAINADVARACHQRGLWVNAADDPKHCDFILPSVVRKGKITLAASTAGTSPALARRLREELTAFLDEDYAPLTDLLAEIRGEVRAANLRVDPETWQSAIDARLRTLVAQGRVDEARNRLRQALVVEPSPARREG